MTDLLLHKPTNLVLGDTMKATYVDGDMFNICERIKEISPDLYIVLLEKDDKFAYAVMEHCVDGVERLVFKVKELDARVCDKLRYLLAMPLAERVAEIEKQEYRLEADRREQEQEELYERFGRPMWTELERTGFIRRGVSYPKRGAAGGKGSAKKS